MNKLCITTLILSVLTGCNGSEGRGAADIAGLYAWDTTTNGGDEGYFFIASDGSVSVYDYAGDSVDEGGNCYWIFENAYTISHVSGNDYLETYTSDTVYYNVTTVIPTDTGIAMSEDDILDENDLGLIRSDLDVSTFTPECTIVEETESTEETEETPIRIFSKFK